MEKRQPGCVTGTARPGCAPRAGNPSITDTPLLSTDSMELHWCFESVPSSCELRGAPARESWALLHANLAQPVHRGPSVMPLEEGQEGALSRAQGLGFQVVFVLLSTPSPAASSPSGLLKGLYSEPEAAQGCKQGTRGDPRQLPVEQNQHPKPPGLRQEQHLPSCLLLLFTLRLALEEQTQFFCWSEQEIPVSSWERPTVCWGEGEISSHRFPPRYRIVSKSCPGPGAQGLCHHGSGHCQPSLPNAEAEFLTLSQVTGRSEMIRNN